MINLQIGQKATDWVAMVGAASAFAWPITVVVMVILLRKEVRIILTRLVSIKGWGIDAQLAQVEDKIVQSLDPSNLHTEKSGTPEQPAKYEEPPPSDDAQVRNENFDRSHPINSPNFEDPVDTVVKAWVNLEIVIRSAAQRIMGSHPSFQKTSFNGLISVLRGAGILDDEMLSAVQQLRKIRNDVVHGVSIDPSQSLRFRSSVDHIRLQIKKGVYKFGMLPAAGKNFAEGSGRSDTPLDED